MQKNINTDNMNFKEIRNLMLELQEEMLKKMTMEDYCEKPKIEIGKRNNEIFIDGFFIRGIECKGIKFNMDLKNRTFELNIRFANISSFEFSNYDIGDNIDCDVFQSS